VKRCELPPDFCGFHPGAGVRWQKNPACEGIVVATAARHCRVLWAGLYETYTRTEDLILEYEKENKRWKK